MLNRIYALPIPLVLLLMALAVLIWTWLSRRSTAQSSLAQRRWRRINGVLAALSFGAVLYTTLLRRNGETAGGLVLRPFQLLRDAVSEPENYRSLLMNVLLFEPLGLTLSQALPPRGTALRQVALTVLAALFLSTAVEAAQYAFGLGRAETDDVLCNTLGALAGALALPLSGIRRTENEKKRNS